MSDWQPIETAPMEAASFNWKTMPLLFSDGERVAIGFVCDRRSDGAWEIDDALSTDHEMYGRSDLPFVPTHWMPLPSPPSITDMKGFMCLCCGRQFNEPRLLCETDGCDGFVERYDMTDCLITTIDRRTESDES